MFASSSFYGPNHPTVEEQVELARRISSSLSDISNRESKGQSMYVNRKKRSVKWVHQGEEQSLSEFSEVSHSENLPPASKVAEKPVLKLVMNPRGQVQDLNSLRHQGVDAPPSPEVCFDLVKDLNSPCGKGAELFAKRRKKAEKWIVDESNVKTSQETTNMSSYESYSSSSTLPQLGKLATPALPTNLANLPTPSYLKDARFTPTGVKNPIPDKYTQPKVRLIKSPWEAALEGSVESAFQDNRSGPSPTPRGHVLIAPSPSAMASMATPPPPLPQTPSSEIYTSRPPKAWHPQPIGKQFSSVKLEQIFEGSPKSPVSLAYHADTNTLSSEPVPVENIPPIAVKLYDYEVIDPSILREPKIRRPDQILAEVQPRNDSPSKGAKWPPAGEDYSMLGEVHWSPGNAQWAKDTRHFAKRPPEQSHTPPSHEALFSQQTSQQLSSPSQQRVTWPPLPQYLEEENHVEQISQPLQPVKPPSYIPQPSNKSIDISLTNQKPQKVIQSALENSGFYLEKTTAIPTQDVLLNQQNQDNINSKSIETHESSHKEQQNTTKESVIKNSLEQSLSELQSVMTQACQNFTRTESSETSTVTKGQESEIVIHKSESVREEAKQDLLQECKSFGEATKIEEYNANLVNICDQNKIRSETLETHISSNIENNNKDNQEMEIILDGKEVKDTQNGTVPTMEAEIKEMSSNTPNDIVLKEASSRKNSIKETQSKVSSNTSEKTILSEQITNQVLQENSLSCNKTENKSSVTQESKSTMNGCNTINQIVTDGVQIKEVNNLESSQITSNISLIKESFSSNEQVMMSKQSIKSDAISEHQQIKESVSNVSNNQVIGNQTMNGMKGSISTSGGSHISLSGKAEKSEYRTFHQQSQYAESETNRTSMSVMSTTDEEVQDLCEREFNQISMQYEKIEKPEIKKPAAIIPGAVKIFPLGDNEANVKKAEIINSNSVQNDQMNTIKDSSKKPYKKPPSMVPGARPLFGEAIELHLGTQENTENDRPYEKIPVKNLIKTFEESTRPHMKYKTKVPDTSHFDNKTPDHQNVEQSNVQVHLESQQSSQRSSLYETFPTDDTHGLQGNTSESENLLVNLTNPLYDVTARMNSMTQDEIQTIHQHYEILKQKKDIYNEHMNMYKEEMKRFINNNNGHNSSTSTNSLTAKPSRQKSYHNTLIEDTSHARDSTGNGLTPIFRTEFHSELYSH